jgi:hypothetical protein
MYTAVPPVVLVAVGNSFDCIVYIELAVTRCAAALL